MEYKIIDKIIKKSYIIYGDKFDYSSTEFKNYKTPIKIKCNKCGDIFEQSIDYHLNGCDCKNCKKILSKEKFIEISKLIHFDKFDYSLVNYKNANINVKIKCNKCNIIFEQRPSSHLNGQGCKNCNVDRQKLTKEKFIEKSKFIHGDKYDYSLVDYKTNKTKVKIICPLHGKFEQSPDNHLSGKGCSKCKESKGEKMIGDFLTEHKINYIKEYRFKDCKYKKPLSFDFYLSELNICIEYDGAQHFLPSYFNKNELFETIKLRDQIKNDYCSRNNIQLIRIKYTENIENKLKKIFNI